jgi:spore coat protein A, manganese oxidase
VGRFNRHPAAMAAGWLLQLHTAVSLMRMRAIASSRLPRPVDVSNYRWATPLPVPHLIDITAPAAQLVVEIGETSVPQIFANAIGSLPAITGPVWGYGPPGKITSPGPTLVAMEDHECRVTWHNRLPKAAKYPFIMPPPDFCATGMMDRYATGHTVVHLHGAHLSWTSDGFPMRLPQTTTPEFSNPTGHSAVTRPGQSVICTYPNTQTGGATLWYHDHTMDRTARNVYAGLAGMYWLRHPLEAALPVLPDGEHEIPLVLGDMSFVEDPDTGAATPFYGDALYLDSYLAERSAALVSGSNGRNRLRKFRNDIGWPMAEFKGTCLCVNGTIWPKLSVEPRPYRFRIVNGATSRFFAMRVSPLDPATSAGNTWEESGDRAMPSGGPPILQIGSDGGFLEAAVELDGALQSTSSLLVLAPGERADIIIDFSGHAGQSLFLTNHAQEGQPFGNGGDHADRRWDRTGVTASMMLTDVLRFDVLAVPASVPIDRAALDSALSGMYERRVEPVSGPTKSFFIREFTDIPLTRSDRDAFIATGRFPNGRAGWIAIPFQDDLTKPEVPGKLWGGSAPYFDPAASHIEYGGLPSGGPEIGALDRYPLNGPAAFWDTYNISADAHPIHIHHTQFRIIERRPIIDKANPTALGPPMFPDKNEQGWKDTVRSNNNEFVRLAVRFSDGGDGTRDYTGNYVMHCHLLDHEDMGMMRPVRIE